MYANLGQQIGGAIEKYQLNKEKREAEERTAMGNLASFSAEELMEFKSRDPKLSKAIDNIQSDNASPKDFNLSTHLPRLTSLVDPEATGGKRTN